MADYIWHPQPGQSVELSEQDVRALAAVNDVFPGSRLHAWRDKPGHWELAPPVVDGEPMRPRKRRR